MGGQLPRHGTGGINGPYGVIPAFPMAELAARDQDPQGWAGGRPDEAHYLGYLESA